jgi:hypothetical protein
LQASNIKVNHGDQFERTHSSVYLPPLPRVEMDATSQGGVAA